MKEGEVCIRYVEGKRLVTNHGGMVYQPSEKTWTYLLVPVNNPKHPDLGRFWIHGESKPHACTPANWVGAFG